MHRLAPDLDGKVALSTVAAENVRTGCMPLGCVPRNFFRCFGLALAVFRVKDRGGGGSHPVTSSGLALNLVCSRC